MSHPLFDMLRHPESALDADRPAPFEAGNVPKGWKKLQANNIKPPKGASENVHHVNLETPQDYIEQEQTIDGKTKK